MVLYPCQSDVVTFFSAPENGIQGIRGKRINDEDDIRFGGEKEARAMQKMDYPLSFLYLGVEDLLCVEL